MLPWTPRDVLGSLGPSHAVRSVPWPLEEHVSQQGGRAYLTKRAKIVAALASAVVLVTVIGSLAAYEQSQRSILPFVYPIIIQCNGWLTVVLYNGDLFVPISYDLLVYGFNQSSGSATTDPTTYSGSLAAHEHRSFSNQLQCGTYKAAVMWNGGGAWHYKDSTVSRNQVSEVDLSY